MYFTAKYTTEIANGQWSKTILGQLKVRYSSIHHLCTHLLTSYGNTLWVTSEQIMNAPQASSLIWGHVNERLTGFSFVWSCWSDGWEMTNPSKESTCFWCYCVRWICQSGWLYNCWCACSHFTWISVSCHLRLCTNNGFTTNRFCKTLVKITGGWLKGTLLLFLMLTIFFKGTRTREGTKLCYRTYVTTQWLNTIVCVHGRERERGGSKKRRGTPACYTVI